MLTLIVLLFVSPVILSVIWGLSQTPEEMAKTKRGLKDERDMFYNPEEYMRRKLEGGIEDDKLRRKYEKSLAKIESERLAGEAEIKAWRDYLVQTER